MVGAAYCFLAVAIRWFGIHFFLFVLFRSIPLGINGYVQFFPFHLIQMTQTEFQTSCEKGALHAAHFWLNKTKTNVTNSFKQSFKCCFRFRVILYQTVCVFFSRFLRLRRRRLLLLVQLSHFALDSNAT